MPSRVADIFAAASLTPEDVVHWGASVPVREPGVYARGRSPTRRMIVLWEG